MKENGSSKKTNLNVRIMAGILAALMLAGTVFGVIIYIV